MLTTKRKRKIAKLFSGDQTHKIVLLTHKAYTKSTVICKKELSAPQNTHTELKAKESQKLKVQNQPSKVSKPPNPAKI